jgi:uridine monophosphate synthetase
MLLLADLYENNIIKYGSFILKSGQTSDYYIDIKSAISYPKLMKKIVVEFSEILGDTMHDENVCICGVPHGAVPFAAALSYETKIPLIMIRKDVKAHGTQKRIEGRFNKNTRVILVEDVITTGASMMEAAQILMDEGLQVIKLLSIVNRESLRISFNGHTVDTLLQIPIKPSLNLCKDYIRRKGKLCVAADMTTSKELIELIHMVGPHISILKIHIDIISDFSEELIYELIKLKHKYTFLIWEDRKFADIGSIVSNQIHGGMYKISSWADLISMHLISGPGILQESGRCGIIAIGSMSSRETLAGEEYLQKCIDMVENNPNVVGVVTQFDFKSNQLKIIPGVNISASADNKDQQYSALSSKSWGNIFVVGRDIANSGDCVQRCKEYKSLI